jgi:hypothetical protein
MPYIRHPLSTRNRIGQANVFAHNRYLVIFDISAFTFPYLKGTQS